ncbi:hypothetical protein ARMSODRAFT_978575 [Armillaria solidipes]|uniref:Glycoside hydrolase family 31 TIM barrel domain-containing protein n=1 Tax=Armillaria solidipes TaxID=1076256 RepID=A0A2H3BKU4_9AGAR|nr:hypothetical protein ARMSODRAFT_978575 [Armillaria solidipes]
MQNYSLEGVQYDGIWLDMNEASSFCDGSYGTGANLTNTGVSFILPGEPGNLVLDYRGSGPVGNMTINGTSTRVVTINQALSRRGRSQYSSICHQQWIQQVALVANGTRASGAVKLDVHNLWGLMMFYLKEAAHQQVYLASSGKRTGHEDSSRPFFSKIDTITAQLGENLSLSGILQLQPFQIHFVGADACGFSTPHNITLLPRRLTHLIDGNTDEELCNRVAGASRTAIAARYSLLPYWYTLSAKASLYDTSPVLPQSPVFPDEEELLGVDRQFLIGRDVLVTPIL